MHQDYSLVICVEVKLQEVPVVAALQQTVQSGSLALARHVHVYLHVGALGVVHVVGYAVVVQLRLPAVQQRADALTSVRQRGYETACILNVHGKGRIAYVGSHVNYHGALYYVVVTRLPAQVGEGIDLAEL